jgi:hypothetical protein
MCVDTRESEQRGAPTLLQCTARGWRASRARTLRRQGPSPSRPSHHFVPGPTASRPLRCAARMCAGAALALDGDIATCGALQHRAGMRPRSLLRLFLTTLAITAGERRTRAGPSAGPGDQPVPRQLVFARTIMCRLTLMARYFQARWPQWLRGAGTTATARQPGGCPALGLPSAACGSLALSPLLPCEPRWPSHSLLPPARDMQVLCYRSDRLGFGRRPATPLAAACSWRLIEYP